ncbi:UDP-glucosyltransferase 74AE2-like isoform X3 [Apium graveolens]|uniref:UDP-glucosyltransferase 74AE2-like isoform X3 n=1 Tax=Apium graveolens TaxID=4045 RepID=UPI003D79D514
MATKIHVFVVVYPVQGHINPMLQFSKRLASKNVRVTLITTSAYKNLNENQPTNPTILFDYISDGFSGEKPSGIADFVETFKNESSKSLPELIEKQRKTEYPVSAIVYDSFMPWVLDISKKFGLYGVSFFTHSCVVSTIYYHTSKGSLRIPVENGNVVSLPSISCLEMGDLPSFVSDLDSYPGVLKLVLDRFSNFEEADCLFFNSFDNLENEVVNWLSSKWKIMTIGPSVPSMFLDKRLADDRDYGLSLFKPDGDACIKWLDGKDSDSVVYVSFGSLANLEQDYMDEIAWGLLDSKCSFIWVVRDTEKSKLSEKFVEESADRGLIVNWSPQLEVLAHKAVGSFMTHCGWNSTLEALSLGVPMMVVPQWTDQTTNAKYIVDVWQTGVRVKAHDKEKITREDVTKSVKDVMEGTKREELKANALKFKEMALEAMSEGGSSDKNIDDFIAEIVTSSTST